MAALMDVARTRRLMVGYTEADVTEPRRIIREIRAQTGNSVSFTAYVARCLALAVAQHPSLNAMRRGRTLVLFDHINLVCYLERQHPEGQTVGFHILRDADRASTLELSSELRAGQSRNESQPSPLTGVPAPLLKPVVRCLSRRPRFLARSGVIAISNVGASGVPGWGFAPSATTVEVTIGGISSRLVLLDGEPKEREYLCLTVSLDHDIIDGLAGARFVRTFLDHVTSGRSLDEPADAKPQEGQ